MLLDKLVTVSGFVECRLVGFDNSQEVLFSARQLPIDLEWDIFDDGRRMVGEAADVQRGGVGLHVGQSPVVLIHLIYLLAELLSEAVEIC